MPLHLKASIISFWGGSNKTIFFVFRYFPNFQNYQNIGYLLNIMFIFDRCHHSLAVETPAKYECDAKI